MHFSVAIYYRFLCLGTFLFHLISCKWIGSISSLLARSVTLEPSKNLGYRLLKTFNQFFSRANDNIFLSPLLFPTRQIFPSPSLQKRQLQSVIRQPVVRKFKNANDKISPNIRVKPPSQRYYILGQNNPTGQPTSQPTGQPTVQPSQPTGRPSRQPRMQPV